MLWLLIFWVTMSQLQSSSRRRWRVIGALEALPRRGVLLVTVTPFLVLQSPKGLLISCFLTWYICVYMVFPFLACQFCFSCLCCPWFARLHSCCDQWQPLWFVFAVGDLWYLLVLVLFHSTFYSMISATEHNYWVLLLTITINHIVAQN